MTANAAATLTVWLVILAMGALTYAIRLSAIAMLGRIALPPAVQRALRFVPPAVLSAFVFPELLRPGGTLALSLGNERLVAGVLAALIAWRTRSVLLTIAVGMATLWALQALS